MKQQQLFDEFYAVHKDKVYRLCRIMVYDKILIEDLYQEVWIRIWKGLDNFKANAKATTWIYRIVVNTSINFNLKQKNHQKTLEHIKEVSPIMGGENRGNELLLDQISRLKSADKILIGLYLEGYPYKEIATILGLSNSHVGVRINRIKGELKNRLSKSNNKCISIN